MVKLTQERLKELFIYDKLTGLFTRAIDKHYNAKKGDVCNCTHKDGRILINVDGKLYQAHRLIWLYVYGYLPEDGLDIDHINRNRSDNRLKNLRCISHQCNVRNRGIQCNNTTGVTGVRYSKSHEKWIAQINTCKKNTYIGIYDNFQDAVKARWDSEVKYNYPTCNTTSSAYEYLKEHNLLDDPLNK